MAGVNVGTKHQIATELAKNIAQWSREAINDHGNFIVAFSGGSLPSILAPGLLNNKDIDFTKWIVLYADERVVPLTHEDVLLNSYCLLLAII